MGEERKGIKILNITDLDSLPYVTPNVQDTIQSLLAYEKYRKMWSFLKRNIVNRDKGQDDPDVGTGKHGF